MVEAESVHQPASQSEAHSEIGRARLWWFVAPLIVGPLFVLLGAFLAVPTQWFALRMNDPWLRGMGYGMNLQNSDCQILIYGDSTAELGLDPAIIRQRTGMSTCNIAETAGLIRVRGNFVLDHYLAHNPPPRVLFMVFGADVFSSRARAVYPVFEPLTYIMGQPHKLQVLKDSPQPPSVEDYFKWAYKGGRSAVRAVYSKPISLDDFFEREHTGGRQTVKDLPMSTCSDSRDNPSPDKPWADDLRTKYSRPGSLLLIEVMPLPECDPGLDKVNQQFAGLVDFKLQQLPSQYYFRGGRHVDTDGAKAFSNMAADQILERLKQSPGFGKP